MAKTDQCVHGALLHACVYCAMGSKSMDDRSDRLKVMSLARMIQIGKDNHVSIDAAIAQRNIMMETINSIAAYLDQPGLTVEDHSVMVCKFMIGSIRDALAKCHNLQGRIDNPRKV